MARIGLPTLPRGARVLSVIDADPVVKLYPIVVGLVEKHARPVSFTEICDAWEATPGMRTGAINAAKAAKRAGWDNDTWSDSMRRDAVEWYVRRVLRTSQNARSTPSHNTEPASSITGTTSPGIFVISRADGRRITGNAGNEPRFYEPKPGRVPWVEVEYASRMSAKTPWRPDLANDIADEKQHLADARREVKEAIRTGNWPSALHMQQLLMDLIK